MPNTMFMRFRDLVESTIPRHKEVIDKFGYVWWAWWGKPEEKVPRNVFSGFNTMIEKKGNLVIFLVDSGTRKLYKAVIEKIDYSESNSPESCSEPSKVPKYYNDKDYLAWIKISKIEEVEENNLLEWSYDEVDEYLIDRNKEKYQDKQILSVKEMLAREHRTIWFAKPFSSGHSTDEISPEIIPTPLYFERTPIFLKSNYLVQISDLHFGENKHNYPLQPGGTDQTLVTLIIDDLRKLYKQTPPGALILSGDFTWSGSEEEFKNAKNFINDLSSAFDLGPERLVVVPGNHDIQWGKEDSYDGEALVEKSTKDARKNFEDFLIGIFKTTPTKYLSMGRRYIFEDYTSLDVIGLNSSMLEQEHFAGYGFVSIEQFNDAVQEMGWDNIERPEKYRIVVMHHHILPVVSQEDINFDPRYSITLDSGQLLFKCLEHRVDLILHGHMHQPFASTTSRFKHEGGVSNNRSVAIHGAGSAGVIRDHLGGIGRNSYSILQFCNDSIILRVRAMSEYAKEFDMFWELKFLRKESESLKIQTA